MRKFALLLAAAPIALTAGAQTIAPPATPFVTQTAYYVDTVNGSDTLNSGSAVSPFKTLTKCITSARTLYHACIGTGTVTGSGITLTSSDNGLTISSLSQGTSLVFDGQSTNVSAILLSGTTGITLGPYLTFQNGANAAAGASPLRAMINVNGGSANTVIANFIHTAGEGIFVTGGASGTLVLNNECDTCGTGLTGQTGSGAFLELQSAATKTRMDSNYVHSSTTSGAASFGTTTQGGAIYTHGANGITVTNNYINSTGGDCVTLQDFTAGSTTEYKIRVEHNRCDNPGNGSGTDFGALYFDGRSNNQQGIWVIDNYIAMASSPPTSSMECIYFDDQTSGAFAWRNTCRKVNHFGVLLHGGAVISISNNIFDFSSNAFGGILYQSRTPDAGATPSTADMLGLVVYGNIFYNTVQTCTTNVGQSSQPPREASNLFSPVTPTNITDWNYYDSTTCPSTAATNWYQAGLSETNATYSITALPFTSYSTGNYTFTTTAAPQTLFGFTPVDDTSRTAPMQPVGPSWYAMPFTYPPPPS